MPNEIYSVNILVSHAETGVWPDMVRFYVRKSVKPQVLYRHFHKALVIDGLKNRLERLDMAVEAIKKRYRCKAEVIPAYAGIDLY